jgi:hypothetical protein
MTKGDEFNKWVNGSTGPEFQNAIPVDRRCKGAPRCRAKQTKTRVIIDAAKEVKDLTLDKDLPPHGVVVARMKLEKATGNNPKNLPERRYGFIDEDYMYYLVVETDPRQIDDDYKRTARWSLVEVDPEGTHTVTARGKFRRCPNSDPQTESHAAFSDCQASNGRRADHVEFQRQLNALRALGIRSVRAVDSIRVEAMKSVINPEEGPIWVACTHGCCIADTGY